MEKTVNNTSIEQQPNMLQDIQYQQQKQYQNQNQKPQQNDQSNNIKDINQVSKLRYKYKWYLVIFCFILQFVQLYTLQELSTNHDNYKQYFKNIIDEDKFEFQYNIIFSISLFILVFLELWTGYLCDQYGSTVILINQWKIMVFGTVLVGLGLFYYQFYFIFIGRVLINVSNSTMWISVSTFIQQYFNALEQSKGQAIMSTSVVAAFVNLNLSPYIVQKFSLQFSANLIIIACIVCLVLSYLLYFIDQNLENQIFQFLSNNNSLTIQNKITFKDQFQILVENIKEIFSYPMIVQLYIIQFSLQLLLAAVLEIVGPVFLAEEFEMDMVQACFICSLSPITSILLIFFGSLADKFKIYMEINLLQSLLQTIALVMLPVFQIQEITFLLYGLGFSLRIMISFPIQALLVPKYISGTTFAITRSIKGFLGFIIQFLNGWIAKNYGYLSVIYIQTGISILALFCAIILFYMYNQMQITKMTYIQKINESNEIYDNYKTILGISQQNFACQKVLSQSFQYSQLDTTDLDQFIPNSKSAGQIQKQYVFI